MLKVHAPETHWLSAEMVNVAKALNAPGVEDAVVFLEPAPDDALRGRISIKAKSLDVANAAMTHAFTVLTAGRETLVRHAPNVNEDRDIARDETKYFGYARFIVFNRPGEHRKMEGEGFTPVTALPESPSAGK